MRPLHFALVASSALVAWAEKATETLFDGVSVPEFIELTPTTWDDEMKKSKFIMVKHFRFVHVPTKVKSTI